MCWKVLTLRLCFVVNPACRCAGVWIHIKTWWVPVRACKYAIYLLVITSQKRKNTLSCFDLSWPSHVRLEMMSIAPLLVISPFKATSGSVPKPAKNVLSSFVLIGLCLEDAGCVNSEHGWCGTGMLLHFISIPRQLSILRPFSYVS